MDESTIKQPKAERKQLALWCSRCYRRRMVKTKRKEADVQLHLRVPRELAERLDAQVRVRDLSAAQLVRAAIAAHLERLEADGEDSLGYLR